MPYDSSTFDGRDEAPVSALDRPLTITKFPDKRAKSKTELRNSLREVAPKILNRSAPCKDALPMLKLGRYGNALSKHGSLRHDPNFLEIDGIECDHDAGTVSVAEAAELFAAAGLAALIYPTSQHTPEHPRWRALFPTSQTLPAGERFRLCARVQGVVKGFLADETFAHSTGWFYGRVEGNPHYEVEVIDGIAIDLAFHLDAGAIGKTKGKGIPAQPELSAPSRAAAQPEPSTADPDDDDLRGEPDWDRIKSALRSIPAAERDDREACWRPIGMALHHETGGSEDGFRLWDRWSRKGSKYDADDQRRVWDSFRSTGGKRLTIATLYHLAKPYERDGRTAKPSKPGRLALLAPRGCAAVPSRGYVVKGFLAPGDVGCIFGAPGAGKSLIGPHIGYMAAQGNPVFGMRTRPGSVFYVAAEDPYGMQSRVTALLHEHGDAPDFALVQGVSDLLAEDSPDLAALKDAIAERRPSLIFLDTLAMAFPGLEENTAEGMGRVVKVARELTQHGAAVVLIHHDTKAADMTPRGHSLLNGALDVALYLSPRDDAGITRGTFTKNRNGTCEREIAFRIATRELGEDEDGDPITAALVAEVTNAPVKKERLSGAERAALDVLNEMARLQGVPQADGRTAVREHEWRDECKERCEVSASDKPNSKRKAITRVVAGLARKGRIVVRDGWVSVPEAQPAPDCDWPGLDDDDDAGVTSEIAT